MGKFYESLTPQLIEFIEKQHLFFVATAPLSPDGLINLSPKGLENFKVINPNCAAYMDFIGSGNETSAHTLENGRITVMLCSFDKVPNILRLYGIGRAVLPEDPEWASLSEKFTIYSSTRQIIVIDIQKIQTSCGYGVPFFTYQGERSQLFDWADKKGEEGLQNYMLEKNQKSLDGLPTHLAKTNRQ
jgi:hypothetical protein